MFVMYMCTKEIFWTDMSLVAAAIFGVCCHLGSVRNGHESSWFFQSNVF